MNKRERRIQTLVADLSSPDLKTSEKAEHQLIRYYAKDAVPFLIEACKDENIVARYRAVWVLGKSKAPAAFDSILRLCDDPSAEVRYDAVLSLGNLGDPRAIEALTTMATFEDPVRPATEALSRLTGTPMT